MNVPECHAGIGSAPHRLSLAVLASIEAEGCTGRLSTQREKPECPGGTSLLSAKTTYGCCQYAHSRTRKAVIHGQGRSSSVAVRLMLSRKTG